MTGRTDSLFLGRIVDADQVYVNGRSIGGITYQYPPRRYALPDGLLQPGRNLIVVRVDNTAGKGGFVPDKPYYLEAGGQKVDLRGEWQYKVGRVYGHADRWIPILAQNEPAALFNTMVAPALPFAIKGFLWCQGEADADHAAEYNALLPALIEDWRAKWGLGDLPFLYVQLPNFMEVQYTPAPSHWAELREAELHALKVPNTGMAVAIDAGEWNDIHPLNKKVVGDRLALLAEKIAYADKTVVAEGPLYESAKVDGDKIVVRFKNGPLVAHDPNDVSVTRGPTGKGDLAQFAISGPDGKFVWANAKIEGDSVIVFNLNIKDPYDVRYAWADNPEGANLYNAAGLPASPFRTDDPYKGDGPWNHKQCAVVLTYDDGIDADLDRVIPALDSVNLKGTFYLIGSANAVKNRMDEWKRVAANGHELGNHSLFHPCDGSQPGRNWVTPDNDLSKYTVTRAVNEIRETNTLLHAIDGKTNRTFAYPCGDLTIKGDTFYTALKNEFVCARGVMPGLQPPDQVELNNVRCYAIQDQSAEYMINLVKQAGQTHTLLVFLFHGVGGGHSINEGWAQHTALLQYLKAHEKEIWIAPMVEVAQYIRNLR
jgi:sialate O-acetylesterase